ncbi:sporulation protein [Litchfieldia alkalitelluris]|uniref:sporulation protein n=1 Tax=Litchfieldia alkalitelluris TaxID=304268 RepID=UPI000996ADC6|nr:sporulation protein [Litchfieldia alkalitelluris]
MSFFNKALASIGIGSAKVDTKLFQDKLIPGEEVKGMIEIKGGSTEQLIDEIYLSVMTTYLKESNDRKMQHQAMTDKFKITDRFTIGIGETKEIPFSFILSNDTPITLGSTKVWLQTGLDIKNALDPSDKDYLKVMPSEIVAAVINTTYDLGFSLRKVECEAAPYRLRTRLPFVQEFEFVPTTGTFRGKLDELEIIFLKQDEHQVDLQLQIDRRVRGLGSLLSEALDMDESFVHLTVTRNDLPTLRSTIEGIINKYS